MAKSKKLRDLNGDVWAVAMRPPIHSASRISVSARVIGVEDAKRLRAWLDKAIAWMEAAK